MRITWIVRSFLDYRIPVYEEIDRLCGNQLTVIYYSDVVPQRCQENLKKVLGKRAIDLSGEIRFGGKKVENQSYSNSTGLRITIRPGLVKIIRKTKPDIILSDGFFQWTYAALAINAVWRTPHLMCYERTMHTERSASTMKTVARRFAARYVNGICYNGVQTKEYLRHLGFPEEKLFLGNMAADIRGLHEKVAQITESEKDALKSQFDIRGPVFLYAGQLIPRKGIMQLLSAWSRFSENNPEPVLVLVGGGEQEDEAKQFIKTEKVNQVKLLGNVDYSEIVAFYAIADIFIIATLEDNWSLVVPEAMSCGLPVLCSKYNGCWPELVKPENGWVFDPLDIDDFNQILQAAWNDKNRWGELGQESLKIIQDFTPEKTAEKIFAACESLNQKK